MHQDLQVLHVIISLVSALELLLGLSGVHSLEDAQSSEILERELELADSLGPSKVLRLLSLLAFL